MPRAAKRKPVVLAFPAALYPPRVVKQAAAAFAEVAPARITRKGATLHVRLSPGEGAPAGEILAGEFGNYALGLACQGRR